MLSFLMVTSLIFSWQMMFLSAPMSLMACLLIISISLSLFLGVLISTWFSIMLFMVYVGGLLVLFMYSAMISSNVKKFWSWNMMSTAKFSSLVLLSGVLASGVPLSVNTSSFMAKSLMGVSLINSGVSLNSIVVPLIGVFLFLVMVSVSSILLKLGKIYSN